MKRNILSLLSFVAILSLPNISSGQAAAPDLGGAENFALFTAAGAIGNVGSTIITGNLGTDAGLISGFLPGVVIGITYNATPTTHSANSNVQNAFAALGTNTCDSTLDYTTGLGNNQVLKPYVYCLVDATSLTDTLILDGRHDPNALFIFLVNGALSTSSLSRIILINEASLRNVYFRLNGAFNSGANSIFRGMIVAAGAINLGHGTTLLGRGLSTADAINLDSNTVVFPSFIPLPVSLLGFSAIKEGSSVRLKWSTATEQSSQNFMVERSSSAQEGTWGTVGTLPAAGNTTSARQYSITDNHAVGGANYYRLRCTDLDGTYSLSNVVVAKFDTDYTAVYAFPNPATNGLSVTGALQGSTISLTDMAGKTLKKQPAYGNGTNQVIISQLAPGTYMLKVVATDGHTTSIRLNKQ